MVSRIRWLLLAAVCSIHFGLIISFLNGGRSSKAASGSDSRLTVQIIKPQLQNTEPQERTAQSKAPADPETAKPPPKITAPLPAIAKTGRKNAAAPASPETSNNEPPPFFNRDKFLDAGELDQSAAASKAFEDALDKALPSTFDSIVLEFLIDETGQTVQLNCIEGDCSASPTNWLQQLLAIPFTPAIKNGQPVASRKVIQFLPTPTFGL